MPELPQQVKARRRRYLINRRLQLGLTIALAGLAATATVTLAVSACLASQRRVESIRSRAHVPYSTAWQASRATVVWAAVASVVVISIAGAAAGAVAARRGKRISHQFRPLVRSITDGQPAQAAKEAAHASDELAAAYMEFARAHDNIIVKAGALADHADIAVEQARLHPQNVSLLADQIARESRVLLAELDTLRLAERTEHGS